MNYFEIEKLFNKKNQIQQAKNQYKMTKDTNQAKYVNRQKKASGEFITVS